MLAGHMPVYCAHDPSRQIAIGHAVRRLDPLFTVGYFETATSSAFTGQNGHVLSK